MIKGYLDVGEGMEDCEVLVLLVDADGCDLAVEGGRRGAVWYALNCSSANVRPDLIRL